MKIIRDGESQGSGTLLVSVLTGKSQDAPQLAMGMNGEQMCTVVDSTPGSFLRKKPRSLLRGFFTLGCSSVFCATGIYAVADQGRTVSIEAGAGIPMILLGLVVWIVPPLFWSVVTNGNGEAVDR